MQRSKCGWRKRRGQARYHMFVPSTNYWDSQQTSLACDVPYGRVWKLASSEQLQDLPTERMPATILLTFLAPILHTTSHIPLPEG